MKALPDKVGLTIVEATRAALEGKVRAMYIMGENPMISDPNTTHVEQAFRQLDFMVVQDIFLTDTAQLAHIVLPAAASLEKDGSFTNTERRVQLIQPVLPPPGQAKPDWEIINEIAIRYDQKMGLDRSKPAWNFSSTAAIMEELASVTPIYAGIRHESLQGKGLQWPCPDEDHPGTAILHSKQFSHGRGKFNPVTASDPFEQPDEEFPLILIDWPGPLPLPFRHDDASQ